MGFSNDVVFVTGANGFVGLATLIRLLKDGHVVRGAVRTEAKAEAVLAHPEIRALNRGGQLTFRIVPDITTAGAYDAAVAGATQAIHIASPLASGKETGTIPADQHEAHFVRPAVEGTLNLLRAAARSGTVHRVVITSSFVALAPLEEIEGAHTRGRPLAAGDRVADPVAVAKGPFRSEFEAYAASKVAALHAAENWLRHNNPPFDVVHLHPGFVLGRDRGAATAGDMMSGTNKAVLALLLGLRFGPFAGAAVHIDDAARAHAAAATDERVYGGEGYIVSRPVAWDDAIAAAKAAVPEAFRRRVFVESGSVVTADLEMDTILTERTFRFELRGFGDIVREVAAQYMELRNRKADGSARKTGAVALGTRSSVCQNA